MEASGFTQDAEDDPFKGSDFDEELVGAGDGENEGETSLGDAAAAAVAAPAAALPVVDREGERVEAPAEPAQAPEAPQAAAGVPAQRVEENAPAEQAPEPAAQPPEPKAPAEEPGPTDDDASAVERTTDDAKVETGTEEQPAAANVPEPASVADQAIASAAAIADEPRMAGVEDQPDDQPEPEDAEPPAQVEAKDGRVTHRRYVVLQPTGPDTFKRIRWYEDKDGNLCSRGTPGAKRQGFALARDADGARSMAFHALGVEKATLVAVSESNFQEVDVEPDEPKPPRRKLKMTRR